MATASHQTGLETITDRAQSAVETGIRALRTARACSRPSALSIDVALEAGANHRRRAAIQYLAANGEADVGELSDVIAAAETDGETPESVSGAARKRVYVSLYQTHLPKLDGLGVVAHDEDTGVVRPTRPGEDLAEWLDMTERRFGGDA